MLHHKKIDSLVKTMLFSYLVCFQIMSLEAQEIPTATKKITLYSHYDTPPFVTGIKDGLTYELANKLNKIAKGLYHFKVGILPRKRLDNLLESHDWHGVVPWVNPAWFNDESKTRFLWTKPMMLDANLVISHKSKPIHYQGPASLNNLHLGGILGHRYKEIESLLKAGKIHREDVVSEFQNIEKLLIKRIDVMFISKSSLNFYLNEYPEFKQQIFIAKQERGRFNRHFLLPLEAEQLTRFLNQAIPELSQLSAWQETVKTK